MVASEEEEVHAVAAAATEEEEAAAVEVQEVSAVEVLPPRLSAKVRGKCCERINKFY